MDKRCGHWAKHTKTNATIRVFVGPWGLPDVPVTDLLQKTILRRQRIIHTLEEHDHIAQPVIKLIGSRII